MELKQTDKGKAPPASSVQSKVSSTSNALGETQFSSIHLTCECGQPIVTEIVSFLNVERDPDLLRQFCDGSIPAARCTCGKVFPLEDTMVVHDPRIPVMVVVIPEAIRHHELLARQELLSFLAKQSAPIPEYAKHPLVIFGREAVKKLFDEYSADSFAVPHSHPLDVIELRALTSDIERREEALLSREEEVLAKQEDLIASRDKLDRSRQELEAQEAVLERERNALRALSVDLSVREKSLEHQLGDKVEKSASSNSKLRVSAKDTTRDRKKGKLKAEVDRWLAKGSDTAVFLQRGQVYLMARSAESSTFMQGDNLPVLFCQYRDTEGFPLVIVGMRAEETSQPDASPALFWLFDARTKADRQVLHRLGEDFVATIELYDEEARAVAAWRLAAPLEANMGRFMQHVETKLNDGSDNEMLDFERACRSFNALGADRLGRKRHNLTEKSFADMPSPAAARLALGVIGYWADLENERYLLDIKSFPVNSWMDLRKRVVTRAIEFGLHLPAPLVAFAEQEKLVKSIPHLYRVLVGNFAEVSLRLKPSDLEAVEEWSNWKLLLADCAKHGVEVDAQVQELAAVSAKRARATADQITDETPGSEDLSRMPEQDVLSLLTDRDQRRDAALELCERGIPETVEPVFAAVRNMTRDEVARVIPAMLQFGRDVIPLFTEGLTHRKSFVRQGCALALGTLRDAESIEPLADMLLKEPTRVWMEAARAIGDLGRSALPSLCALVGSVDGEGRERIAWALAHIARDDEARDDVGALAKVDDQRLKKLVRRSFEMLEFVQKNDSEVRGRRRPVEQTIIRSFTRRFFESMSGEFKELGEEDIVEQREVSEAELAAESYTQVVNVQDAGAVPQPNPAHSNRSTTSPPTPEVRK